MFDAVADPSTRTMRTGRCRCQRRVNKGDVNTLVRATDSTELDPHYWTSRWTDSNGTPTGTEKTPELRLPGAFSTPSRHAEQEREAMGTMASGTGLLILLFLSIYLSILLLVLLVIGSTLCMGYLLIPT